MCSEHVECEAPWPGFAPLSVALGVSIPMSPVLLVLAPAVAGAATPTASSVGKSSDGTEHPATHAFDGLLDTAWAEGELGEGEGAWIEVRFDRPVDVSSVSIWPGWMGGVNRDIRLHGRPRNITITFDVVEGEDVIYKDRIMDPGEEQRPVRYDMRAEAPQARSMRVTIDQVYPGGIYADCYITELAVNFAGGESVAQVAGIQGWQESRAGERAEEAQREQAIALFEKISAEEFGDRDSLRTLMDWAGNGAPYLRRQVANRVPWGFRLNALRPDATSIEALLKLKDANAVAALERASLRTFGKASDELMRRAHLLAAYADVLGGGRRNIDPWGEEGFERGALRSFGEPLSLAVDEYGGLYVTDVANHRVQRYNLANGMVEEVFGNAEAKVTDVWFARPRPAYASGATPTAEGNGFILPIDVDTVPGPRGDTVYVLDVAKASGTTGSFGRITEIKPDGTIGHQQILPFGTPISAKAGGEAHLMVNKKTLVVVWANEGIQYSLPKWEASDIFSLQDGSARGGILLSGSKIGLIYGSDLVMYNTDGFRYGSIMGPDTLGPGYEDWDIAYDEEGKPWVALDTGEVLKLKKPGKVDFRFRMSDDSLTNPRIDVYDDMVYVTRDNQILRADALELLAEQSMEGETGATMDVGLGGE